MATVKVKRPQRSATGVQNPKTFAGRCTEDELRAIRIAAAKRNVKVAEWLREVVIPVALREAA